MVDDETTAVPAEALAEAKAYLRVDGVGEDAAIAALMRAAAAACEAFGGVTLSARRPEKLEAAAEQLRGEGIEAEAVAANMVEEDDLKNLLARHESRFGRLDVLVGTQLAAKGLDLPSVTLAAVIAADVTLNLPDYRAAERTFQLLAQVAGRAGRGTGGCFWRGGVLG